MACNILDFKCIIVNELVGSVVLSILLLAILYFIVASKVRLGFDTTIAMFVPFVLLSSLLLVSFSAIYAFITVIVGIILGYIFMKFIENR